MKMKKTAAIVPFFVFVFVTARYLFYIAVKEEKMIEKKEKLCFSHG